MHRALFASDPLDSFGIKDSSGRSGAAGYLVSRNGTAVAMLKVTGGSVLHTHPATAKRMAAATEVLREVNNAPALLLSGPTFT